MTLREAYFFLKDKKSDIQPNKGFMSQLIDYDKELHGAESFNLEVYFVDVLREMGFQEGV